MRRFVGFLPLVLILGTAVALPACGSDKESASSITHTTSNTRSTEDESTTSSKRTTTTTRRATTTVPGRRPHLTIPTLPPTSATVAPPSSVPPATRTVTDLTGFTSPSGNIYCYIDPTYVRCDIGERSWDPPPMPAACDLDWGQGVEMSAGATPTFVSAGDTAYNEEAAVAYGQSIAAGSLRCDSAESGMTCKDVATGRGFTLSKEAYALF